MASVRVRRLALSSLALVAVGGGTADASVWCQRAGQDEGAVNLRVGPSTNTAVLGLLTGHYSLEKVGDDAAGNGCPGRWLILRWQGHNVRACGTYLYCRASTTATTPAPAGATLCRQNSPSDGFANLRSSPTINAAIVARLTGTTALAMLGEVSGGGCARNWAKLSYSGGRVVYACKGVLTCGGAPVARPPAAGADVVTQSRVRLNVPYYYQFENANRPGGTCNITSLAMALSYRGVRVSPDNIFTDAQHVRGGVTGAVYDGESLARIGREYGLRNSRAVYGASAETVKAYLRQKVPFILQGYFSNWNFGHILLITGYDDTGWYINDPAGIWNGDTGNEPYRGTRTNHDGKGVHYSYDAVSRNSLAGRGAFTGAVVY